MIKMAKPTKKAVNVLVEEQLLQEARNAEINVSAIVNKALRDELARLWQVENAEAFEANRKDVEENGLWSDGLRMW
jgi:antitoxin CcdA